jgi:nucleoside 2-deoxyribosyltransferase
LDKTIKNIKIYLAGPLFGIADRHHNLLLALRLESLGYEVILPQKEALKFTNGSSFDLRKIVENCSSEAMKSDCIVANVDGADADSGTAIEIGIGVATAMASIPRKPVIICIRTDSRTDIEREKGMNAMIQLADRVIYKPALVNTLDQVHEFYANLANEMG